MKPWQIDERAERRLNYGGLSPQQLWFRANRSAIYRKRRTPEGRAKIRLWRLHNHHYHQYQKDYHARYDKAEENIPAHRKAMRDYYSRHSEEWNKYRQKFRETHDVSAYLKKYREEHKEEIAVQKREYMREYMRKRRAEQKKMKEIAKNDK